MPSMTEDLGVEQVCGNLTWLEYVIRFQVRIQGPQTVLWAVAFPVCSTFAPQASKSLPLVVPFLAGLGHWWAKLSQMTAVLHGRQYLQ